MEEKAPIRFRGTSIANVSGRRVGVYDGAKSTCTHETATTDVTFICRMGKTALR